jgi:endonuclease YncB( thermonuclease family)
MDDFRARVTKPAYDGDTWYYSVLQVYRKISYENDDGRMYGYNAIKLGTPAGRAARDRLRELLPIDSPCVIYTYGPEKYGRMLTVVINHAGLNVNQTMLAEGHGVPYDGTGPREVFG